MSDELDRVILNLRTAILSRRVKQKGKHLPYDDAKQLVVTSSDDDAYHQTIQKISKPLSLWGRLWGAR